MPDTLKLICDAIRNGQDVDRTELGSLLSLTDIDQRFRVNEALARAYFYFAKDYEKALVFAERALFLSGLSETFLEFYIEVQATAGSVEARRAAYKKLGMRYAAKGDVYSALRNFNLNRDAYALSGFGNRYAYDLDVLDRISGLAHDKKLQPSRLKTPAKGERVRLAYLVFHVHHPESVIVKLLNAFAKHHDATEFEAVFFVPESNHRNNQVSRKNIELLGQTGARVVQVNQPDALKCMYEVAGQIQIFAPHILITTALLAEYAHYFIASLVRAPVRIGLVYGPPELYVAPDLDWVLTSTIELLIDAPCNGSVIPIEYQLPASEALTIRSRGSLGIPSDAVVILSAGRPMKFMCREFWEAILSVLDRHADAVFLVVGIDEFPSFYPELVTESARSRVFRLGWQSDYLTVLGVADVVVDTYPSGGGVVNVDAAALSIPVVSFRHDYLRRFDQMSWSAGENLLPVPELLVARGKFDQLQDVLSSLIQDPSLRTKLGGVCREIARKTRGSPARYVERHETAYKSVLKRKLAQRSGFGGALKSARTNILSKATQLLKR